MKRTTCLAAAATCLLAVLSAVTATHAVVVGETNIAAAENGGVILYATSAADNSKWAARNLIDGKRVRVAGNKIQLDDPESFGWSSADTTFPQEIVFAFKDQKPRLIGKIVIDPVTADPDWQFRWAKNFEIAVSNTTQDGTYDPVGSYELANKYLPHGQSFELAHPVEARYVKLRITSNQGSNKFTELGEVEVYEAIVGGGELGRLIRDGEDWLTRLQRFRDGREFVVRHPSPGTAEGARSVAAAADGAVVISASSEHSDPRWAKENLIDGQHVRFVNNQAMTPSDSWGWSSADASFPQEIVIQLSGDEPVLIDSVVADPATAESYILGRAAKGLEILTSVTGPTGPWHLAGRFSLMNRPEPQPFEFTATEARWVMVRILSNHGSDKFVELGEIEVYQAIIPQEPLTQIVSQGENLLRELKLYRDALTAESGGE